MGACGHIWKSVNYMNWKKSNKRNIKCESVSCAHQTENKIIIYNFFGLFLCVCVCVSTSSFNMTQNLVKSSIELACEKKADQAKREYQYRVSWLHWFRKRENERWQLLSRKCLKLINFNFFLSLYYLDLICFAAQPFAKVFICIELCTKNFN